MKWIEGRRENIQATIHGRGQVGYIEVGCNNDGSVTGLRYNVFADLGSYHQLLTPAIPTLTGLMLSGSYKIPAIQINVTGVFTNKMATDAYRGAGRPEATHVVERAMDLVAAELNMDPVAVRRRNFPAPDEFPFKTATGLFYDSGNYEGALAKALQISDYDKLRAEQQAARAAGKIVGIGLSTYVEICALGPSQAMPAGGWESATVRIEPTGKVTVLTGASPHGQGQETSFAQIAADELGVDLGDVTVIHGDTSIVQYGIGTFGSRATAVGGTAVFIALQRLKEKATKIAAHMLKTEAANVAFKDSRFSLLAAESAAAGEVPEPIVPLGEAPAGALPEPENNGKDIDTYSARLRTGVGAIKGDFQSTVRLEEMRPPEHYRIVVDGKGGPGFVKGSGNLDLEERDGLTVIKYTGELQVGGPIAGVGQRMIQGTAKMMASQFFTALEAEAQTKPGDTPPEHGFFRTALRWLSGMIDRLLRR